MSTIHLHQTTTSTPEQYVAGLTDFGPGRSNLFGNSADEYLKGLGAFMRAVTELFGPEQARVAAEDWVDELEFVDILPEPAGRDWRSVTIAAAARLAKRLNVDADRRTPRDTPADTKVSPILSSNCPAAIRLLNRKKGAAMNQTDKVLYTAAVHTTGGREGPRLRRHCCKTSLAKPRAPLPLGVWSRKPSARRPGRAGSHF